MSRATSNDVAQVLRPDAGAFLSLLRAAFAYMDGRVDPPSSLHRMTEQDVRDFAAEQMLLSVFGPNQAPIACLFVTVHPGHLYLGKWAVHPEQQGRGLARKLLEWVEENAWTWNAQRLVLETRIELIENLARFARMGFAETARTAHPGYDRPTSVRMQKDLAERTQT